MAFEPNDGVPAFLARPGPDPAAAAGRLREALQPPQPAPRRRPAESAAEALRAAPATPAAGGCEEPSAAPYRAAWGPPGVRLLLAAQAALVLVLAGAAVYLALRPPGPGGGPGPDAGGVIVFGADVPGAARLRGFLEEAAGQAATPPAERDRARQLDDLLGRLAGAGELLDRVAADARRRGDDELADELARLRQRGVPGK